MLRLNLGCSDRYLAGFCNVDLFQPVNLPQGVDFVQWDLTTSWPWLDNSVDYIQADDIIEHLPNKIHTMNEAWRVLRPGGFLNIFVPTTDGRGAFQDPTHVSFWNRNSFFYFTEGDPHLVRFAAAYGIRCAFKVIEETASVWDPMVTKLHIRLQAVK